jgi:hypothetical protein
MLNPKEEKTVLKQNYNYVVYFEITYRNSGGKTRGTREND